MPTLVLPTVLIQKPHKGQECGAGWLMKALSGRVFTASGQKEKEVRSVRATTAAKQR